MFLLKRYLFCLMPIIGKLICNYDSRNLTKVHSEFVMDKLTFQELKYIFSMKLKKK